MNQIVIIAHNIRSTHNVGSILRTADGFGVNHIYLSGYTPYPTIPNDTRIPHIANKLNSQISKTALGAEKSNNISYVENVDNLISDLKSSGFTIAALEQSANSVVLDDYKPPSKIAVILGSEVKGLDNSVLELAELCIEIPMFGDKESFNVSVAGGITMYHLRLIGNKLIK